jgi:hypothetical protein
VIKAISRPAYSRERYPQDIAQEGGWAPGPDWIGAENFNTSGFDTRTVNLQLTQQWVLDVHFSL